MVNSKSLIRCFFSIIYNNNLLLRFVFMSENRNDYLKQKESQKHCKLQAVRRSFQANKTVKLKYNPSIQCPE